MMKRCRWSRFFSFLLALILCVPLTVSASEAGSGTEGTGEAAGQCSVYFQDPGEVDTDFVNLVIHGSMDESYIQQLKETTDGTAAVWNDIGIVRWAFRIADSGADAVAQGATNGASYVSTADWQEIWQAVVDFNAAYPAGTDGGQEAFGELEAIVEKLAGSIKFVTDEEAADIPEVFGVKTAVSGTGETGSKGVLSFYGLIGEDYLQQLINVGNSGHAFVSQETEGFILTFWTANSPEDIYAVSSSAVLSQCYLTLEETESLKDLVEKYNSSYPYGRNWGKEGFDAALALLQEFVNMAKDIPDWYPEEETEEPAITTGSGSMTDPSTGEAIQVQLKVEEITAETQTDFETKLKPQAEAILKNDNMEGYVLAEIQEIYIVNTTTNEKVDVSSEVKIAIPYPAGYGAGDSFAVYHWDGNVWENVAVEEKSADGIICTVYSLSPFAVAAKKADAAQTPSEDTDSSGSGHEDGNQSSGNASSGGNVGGSESSNSGNGTSAESVALTDIPQTGDFFPLAMLSVLAAVSAAVWAGTYGKKKTES